MNRQTDGPGGGGVSECMKLCSLLQAGQLFCVQPANFPHGGGDTATQLVNCPRSSHLELFPASTLGLPSKLRDSARSTVRSFYGFIVQTF